MANSLESLYNDLAFYEQNIALNNKALRKLYDKYETGEISPEQVHLMRSLEDANASLERSKQQRMSAL